MPEHIAKTWKCIHTFIGYSKEISYKEKTYTIWGDNESISISNDCQLLATINKWGKAEIWDISKKQLIYCFDCSYDFDQYNDRSHWVSELALMSYTLGESYYISILSDNQTLITGSRDKTVKLWNLSTGKLLQTLNGHQHPVKSITISFFTQIMATTDYQGTTILWQAF